MTMLILTRYVNEEIVIGEGASQVVVQVVGIREGQVRLGVTADPRIPVHRREVRSRIDREQSDVNDQAPMTNDQSEITKSEIPQSRRPA